jgi:hypothetical protein
MDCEVWRIGEGFTRPPAFDQKAVLKDSNRITAVVFVQSVGGDAFHVLKDLSVYMKQKDALVTVPRGQAEDNAAREELGMGKGRGLLVFLESCHV